MQMHHDGHVATGDIVLDSSILDLEIVTLPGGGVRLYATTGAYGGMSAWRLDGPGLAVETDRQYFPNWMASSVDGIGTWMGDGGAGQIVIGGAGGGDLLCYRLGSAGQITSLETADGLRGTTDRIADLTHVEIGGTGYVYIADQGTGQVSGYRVTAAGDLTALGDAGRVGAGMAVELEGVTLDGQGFLLVADDRVQGVTSYRVDVGTGALTQIGQAAAVDGLGVATPTALEVVEAFGQSFVLLGAAGSSSLSVMRLTADGGLEITDHQIDGLATRFGGLTALAVAQQGERVFVVAGGADDGLSLFTLLPDGRLLHLSTLEHSAGAGLENVSDIAVTVIGDDLRIYVTSGAEGGISQYSADLSDLGQVLRGTGRQTGGAGDDLIEAASGDATLRGRDGDDILVASEAGVRMSGGPGADTFMLSADAGTFRITDFLAGVDRLDLSDFPMLRSTGQLGHTATASGARLTFRDTTIEIISADGAPLSLADIFGPGGTTGFAWADRILPPPGGERIAGSAGNDTLRGGNLDDTITGGGGVDLLDGGSGQDTLRGGAGNDTLMGLDGDDRLIGDGGDDGLWGGTGADTVLGGFGNDTLGGFTGADSLSGEDGRDEIWGHDGDDTGRGGPGNDTLGGGNGRDRLFGDAGADLVWGGHDGDHLDGGDGQDTLGGFSGDDTMDGGAGNDEIWGNSGDDLGWGGAGDDLLAGYTGNDTLHGGAGGDDLRGGTGDDRLEGDDGDDTLQGQDGDDHLLGGTGHDGLWGGSGADTFEGGWGNDTLGGFIGDDHFFGGGGDDEIWGHDGADLGWGGAGNDRLGGGNDSDTLAGEAGDDLVWGGHGGDSLTGGDGQDTLGGFSGDDTMAGGAGNDEIWGNSGADQAWGGDGDDLLAGYTGNDTLHGGNGNDDLRGGAGDDRLSGGWGADVFVFSGASGNDVITDFQPDVDHIHITTPGAGFGDLTLVQTGTDVTVWLPQGSVVLENLQVSVLDAGDFLFG